MLTMEVLDVYMYVFNIVMLIIESSVKMYPIFRRCLMLTNQFNNLPPSLQF